MHPLLSLDWETSLRVILETRTKKLGPQVVVISTTLFFEEVKIGRVLLELLKVINLNFAKVQHKLR